MGSVTSNSISSVTLYDPQASLHNKLHKYISDIRARKINNELKINDAKTECIIFLISTSEAGFEWFIRQCR